MLLSTRFAGLVCVGFVDVRLPSAAHGFRLFSGGGRLRVHVPDVLAAEVVAGHHVGIPDELMLRLTHHGDGLVHGALVAVLLIVAILPVVAVGVAGGGVGEEVVSEGNLPSAIRVVASRDDHDIVRGA